MTEGSSGTGSALGRARSENRPRWVLDTNVVLDWLIFDDAAMRAPGASLQDGLALWIATAAMREEALEVAARAVFSKRGPANALCDRVAQGYARYAQHIASTAPSSLICADPDDQMFIDLALQQEAQWLLTRDKALLALASPALARGLRIARPQDIDIPAWLAA
ncbi:hypothetical protein GALL_265140 [mine drainage metagenome]|uniref:PIN domain-containing protein n=1 Tax=mine drainage metagenome TaxID=410659 RepID=A0A1J5R6G4_9ZZZZ